MSNSTSQYAQALELLRLLHAPFEKLTLLLGALAERDVAREPDRPNYDAARIANRCLVRLEPLDAAGLRDRLFDEELLAALDHPQIVADVALGVLERPNVAIGLAQDVRL